MKAHEAFLKSDAKKHRRIKSQQPIINQSNTGQNCFNNKPYPYIKNYSCSTYLLQVIKPDNQMIKIVVNSDTDMKKTKQMLFKRLDLQPGTVYFFTVDQDYNFDYRLQQQIGNIDNDKKIKYQTIKTQKNKNNHYNQDNNLSSYIIFDCLSVGGFSKVFIIRSKKSGKFYAAKFVDKNHDESPKFRDLIYNQKYINQLLDHPMLVKMHQFIETKDFYIFILDFCPSGELFCLMKSHRDMSQNQAKFYFIQTILAIDYMHSKSIIYRDIKPENILLDKNGHVKIADFGLAKIMREKSTSYCGSLQYMAPEIVLGDEHSFGVDHYCLGSLLFEMMVGCPPFYNPNFSPSQTKYHIVNSQVKFPSRKDLSIQLIDFVSKLLDKNPKTRLGSLGGIKQILAHPWIGKFDKQMYQKHLIQPPFKIPLNQNNFQTTYLPKDSIEQIKQKINEEIQQQNKENGIFKRPHKNSFKMISDKQKARNRLKSTDQSHKLLSIISPKNNQESNPYVMSLFKNSQNSKKNIINSSKNIIKNQSKSLHITNNNRNSNINIVTKNRSLTKIKNDKQTCQSNLIKNILSMCNSKQKQLLRKSLQSSDDIKKSHNVTLHRKSGNFQKENAFKFKLQTKSKGLKKVAGGMHRNTFFQEKQRYEGRNNKLGNKISKALISPFIK